MVDKAGFTNQYSPDYIKAQLDRAKADERVKVMGCEIKDYDVYKKHRDEQVFYSLILIFFIIVGGFALLACVEVLSGQMQHCLETLSNMPVPLDGGLELCKAVTVGWW